MNHININCYFYNFFRQTMTVSQPHISITAKIIPHNKIAFFLFYFQKLVNVCSLLFISDHIFVHGEHIFRWNNLWRIQRKIKVNYPFIVHYFQQKCLFFKKSWVWNEIVSRKCAFNGISSSFRRDHITKWAQKSYISIWTHISHQTLWALLAIHLTAFYSYCMSAIVWFVCICISPGESSSELWESKP